MCICYLDPERGVRYLLLPLRRTKNAVWKYFNFWWKDLFPHAKNKKRSQSHINEYYICFIVGHWLAHFHSPSVQVCFVFLKQMTISQNGAKKKRTANLNSFYCEKMSPFRPFIIRGFSFAKSHFRLESCRSEIHKLQTVVKDTRKLEF